MTPTRGKAAGDQKYGNVTLSEGDNITITVEGDDFEVAAPNAAEISDETPEDVADQPGSGASPEASRADHVHRGVTAIALFDTPQTPHYGTILVRSVELGEAHEDWDRWVILAWDGDTLSFSAAAPVVQGGNIIGIRNSLHPGEFFVWEP